jgi:glycosyltransferase involved in cell wall biosynthesis
VAIVSLGRPQATGEVRRTKSWRALFAAAGAEVRSFALIDHGSPWAAVTGTGAVVRGRAVPEVLVGEARRVERELRELDPERIVFVTLRSLHPRLASFAGQRAVVDLVDVLSESYRLRASLATRFDRRAALNVVAQMHARSERYWLGQEFPLILAGYTDAEQLGCTWVPNMVIEATELPLERVPDVDLLFVGNLAYAPNIDALRVLDGAWTDLLSVRPRTTALVAGARPTPEVLTLCERRGWELQADFDSIGEVYSRARLAVSPLRLTTGIQNKVLDAAAHGVAQVVSPAALAGLAPGFPAVEAGSPSEWIEAVTKLLEDDDGRRELARQALQRVRTEYGIDNWVGWAERVLQPA